MLSFNVSESRILETRSAFVFLKLYRLIRMAVFFISINMDNYLWNLKLVN